jgi:hypothetical protein
VIARLGRLAQLTEPLEHTRAGGFDADLAGADLRAATERRLQAVQRVLDADR